VISYPEKKEKRVSVPPEEGGTQGRISFQEAPKFSPREENPSPPLLLVKVRGSGKEHVEFLLGREPERNPKGVIAGQKDRRGGTHASIIQRNFPSKGARLGKGGKPLSNLKKREETRRWEKTWGGKGRPAASRKNSSMGGPEKERGDRPTLSARAEKIRSLFYKRKAALHTPTGTLAIKARPGILEKKGGWRRSSIWDRGGGGGKCLVRKEGSSWEGKSLGFRR